MPAPVSEQLWPDVQPEAARRLLQAGLESFAERGYHATTTRDIATAAGMSPAALYVYFPSKLALLFAISRSGHEQTLQLVEKAAAEGGDPPTAIRRMVERFVAWHAQRHTRARVVQYELNALGEQDYATIAAMRRQIEQHFRATVERGVATGDFTVPDVRIAARAAVSLGIDVARWYNERSGIAPTTLGQQYGELVLRMLGAG